MFGRATITLGIGPHSSLCIFQRFLHVTIAQLYAERDTDIKSCNLFVMAALRIYGHYFFALWFLLLAALCNMGPLCFCPVVSFMFLSNFISLSYIISAVADWMSAILLHMMWP